MELCNEDCSKLLNEMDIECSRKAADLERLKNLDLLVFDNSLRESTVGALRGHTLTNKWKIFDEIQDCGFQYKIVAAFSHMTRVDEPWVQELVASGEDVGNLFAFSEAFDTLDYLDDIPLGLRKMKRFGLVNPIIEIDLCTHTYDFWKSILHKRIKWIKENMRDDAKIMVNFRDVSEAMFKKRENLIKVLYFLSTLPSNEKPFGIVFEEPTGNILPSTLRIWTRMFRTIMDKAGWHEGHLSVHIHEKWGLADMAVLECLIGGANGIWASICEEGAALGHACTIVTIMNLLRLGNTKVRDKYNLKCFREAAINVTKITTGQDPHCKKPVYGERALDIVFGAGGMGMGAVNDFDLAGFFGQKAPVRISTMSDFKMIIARLKDVFGDDSQFDDDIGKAMFATILEDLRSERKEEYMSEVGLALLFDRSGGQLTKKMSDVIDKVAISDKFHRHLIREVREMWDTWNLKEGDGDEALNFDSFYNGFMSPFFGCFSCEDTRKGLKALDFDADEEIHWKEFMVYIKWTLRQYSDDIHSVDDLLSLTFRKGLIPAMQDVVLGRSTGKSQLRINGNRGF